mgnify:CR=1 FL=1
MILREMLVDDLDQVMKIENELFSPPWTKEGFFTYLTRKDAMFLVVEEKGEILAYCGLIMVLDEGDITNVAVRPDRQKEGIGHFLTDSLIRLAEQQGVTTIHLEVRTGNGTASVFMKEWDLQKTGSARNTIRIRGRCSAYDQASAWISENLSFSQNVTHILQKAFFKHASVMVYRMILCLSPYAVL